MTSEQISTVASLTREGRKRKRGEESELPVKKMESRRMRGSHRDPLLFAVLDLSKVVNKSIS